MRSVPQPIETMIPSLPARWERETEQVLADGSLALMGRRASAPAGDDTNARIWIVAAGQLVEMLEFKLESHFAQIEQFPDGRWLVVEASHDPQGNARLFDPDGTQINRFQLGHGIQHVKLDAESRIWVGWFDEGVFGNDRWQIDGHEWPPSSYGIAAFDDAGILQEVASRQLDVADCYALNVQGNQIWACTYTDFPLWCWSSGTQKTWTTELAGTSAIAVQFPYVVAFGGYGKNAHQAVLFRLENDTAVRIQDWLELVPAFGKRTRWTTDARGDTLHIIEDDRWLRWHVSDFVNAAI